MFGVGCLAAPFVVRIWQLDAFAVLGLVNLISIVGYYWLKSPEDKTKKAKEYGTKIISYENLMNM